MVHVQDRGGVGGTSKREHQLESGYLNSTGSKEPWVIGGLAIVSSVLVLETLNLVSVPQYAHSKPSSDSTRTGFLLNNC
jgi:hypothetical protein